MSRDADDLCRDCGICCNGTLFSSVAIEPDDTIIARQHRLPMVETPDGMNFPLPCAALRDVTCAIYLDRPAPCGDFACELRLGVEAHELDPAEARDIIDETRAVQARVTQTGGERPWWSQLRETRSALAAAKATASPLGSLATQLEDLVLLQTLVHRHFLD